MKRYLAEFIGAFFLVFVGAGSIIADVFRSRALVTDSFGLLGIAIAHGLALAVAIAAIARISGGHANPAISISFWVARRISATDMFGYVVFQLLGGAAAAFLLKILVPAEAFSNAGAGIPAVAEGISSIQAVGMELFLTFFLGFVIWGVAVDQKGPKALAPFAIGLTVTFAVLVGGTFTGAALNPARWFGPALASGQWSNAFVYIAGPILGALLASLIYEVFFLEEDEPDHGDIAVDEESARDWSDTPSPLVPPSGREPAEGPDSPLVPPEPLDAMSIPAPRPESEISSIGSASMASATDESPTPVREGRMADTEGEGMGTPDDRMGTDTGSETSATGGPGTTGTGREGTWGTSTGGPGTTGAGSGSASGEGPGPVEKRPGMPGDATDETPGSATVLPGSSSAPGPTGSSEMPPTQSDQKPETESEDGR